MQPDFPIALLTLGAAAFACRAGGFFLMRYIHVSPALDAALRATPLAVMLGIIAPVVATGRVADIAGIVVAAAAVKLGVNDILAVFIGVAVVAIARALGG